MLDESSDISWQIANDGSIISCVWKLTQDGFITKDIKVPSSNQNIGKIAVVGPTRMNYEKVLQYLEYVVKMVAFHLSDLERKEYGR